nr:MAG TPA: Neurensin [Caudoviricetes sp.]
MKRRKKMNNSMDLIGVLLMVASIILIAAGYFWKE